MSKLSNESQADLLQGKSPADVILNHAKEHYFDLIIMGSRELTGIKELLWNVSHAVVQNSHFPVFIIK
jgi:nucleotide-binding universal stress UspA family protein